MATQGPMTRAVAAALKAAQLQPQDQGAAALIRRYARLLDDARGTVGEADLYERLGPKLLQALTSVGCTLAGRKSREVPKSDIAARVDEFTARRAGQRPA